jgi:hypothetical protein
MSRKANINYVEFSAKETIVTLAEDRGQAKENGYGPYFLRNFEGKRFTCANPDLERCLIDSGARAGMPVGITREKYGQGSIWKVRILGEVPGPQSVPSHKSWPNHPVHRELPPEKYAPSPTTPPPDLVPVLAASIAHIEAQKKPAASAATSTGPVTSLLTKCAIAAIDAAAAAEAYAVARGFPLKFREEQVQAWASTLYIGESKQSNINLMHRNETLRQNGGGQPWRQ